jgi:class 3 adenylate cyclase
MVAAPLRAGTSSTRAKTDEQKSPAIRVTSEQPGISATIEGERETVTALFADIKGSTELIEVLGPEDAPSFDPALKLMIDAVQLPGD